MAHHLDVLQSMDAKRGRISSLCWACSICAAVLFMSLVSGCSREPVQAVAPSPPDVDVARPVVRDVTEWDEFTGRLSAIETVEVRPRVSGYLESVHFREGQLVHKGDLLFVIDPRPFRAVLAATEADVAGTQARLELARNDLERSENLVRTGAVSAEDYDRRSKAVVEAQAAHEAAKARRDQAKLDVEFTEIRAPIDGRVSNYAVTVGNLVNGGSAGQATLLTTIVSLNPIHCYIDASEQDYLKYTRLAASGSRPSSRDAANPVLVSLADESDFRHRGVMDFVDNRIDPFTGTIRGRAVLDNPDGLLLPGMFVRLRLIGETLHDAVLIPDAAIGADQANRVVYVLDDNDVVTMRTITPGRMIDGLRVVRSGLSGQERVIVNGLQRVRPGITVKPNDVSLQSAESAGAVEPASDDGR